MDMLLFLKILIASIVATSIMTIVSYSISYFFKKLYKEPVLLNYLLVSLQIGNTAKKGLIYPGLCIIV